MSNTAVTAGASRLDPNWGMGSLPCTKPGMKGGPQGRGSVEDHRLERLQLGSAGSSSRNGARRGSESHSAGLPVLCAGGTACLLYTSDAADE